MPSKLAKVQKSVNKKKGGTKLGVLHENSRDAQRLRRASARDDKITRHSLVRQKANGPWLERMEFFKLRQEDPSHPMDIGQILAITKEFIARNDAELHQLRSERRPGRPSSNKQTLLEQQKKLEESELTSGFWVPNLQDVRSGLNLKSWKGDWAGLGVLNYLRIDVSGCVRESNFPPRGSS